MVELSARRHGPDALASIPIVGIVFVVVLVLVLASGCARRRPQTTSRPVLVTVVVDQLPAWALAARIDALPADGGFARLRREGTWVRDMRYAHAVTETAPGHAALYTGTVPRASGVIANELVDPATSNRVSVLRDPGTALLGVARRWDAAGSSPVRIRVETLADQLRAAYPGATVVSFSLKDRGAIPGAGRRPDAAVWFDAARDAFVTSTAFGAEFPTWLRPYADGAALARARERAWVPLDEPWLRAHAATGDDQPGEGDLAGLGPRFPHRAQGPGAGTAFRATPFADEVLLAMVRAGVERARSGAGTGPALVAVSLSANDYIGHTFGPDSWESWDELRRLDASLAGLMAWLDAALGTDGWYLMLASDHGVTTMPEATERAVARSACGGAGGDRWARPCDPGVRILPDALGVALQAEAVRVLGPGAWVAGVPDPYVALTPAARALDPVRRTALHDALHAYLLAQPGVANVIDVAAVSAECPGYDDVSVDALVCRSVVPGEGGEFYVVPRPGSFFDARVVSGYGANHGTPYAFDRSVPLFVRAPGRVAAGRVIDGPLWFSSFARTGAALLGVEMPHARAGADLTRTGDAPLGR